MGARVVYQNGDVGKDGKPIVVELKLPEMPKRQREHHDVSCSGS
jgi:hypothetical protein